MELPKENLNTLEKSIRYSQQDKTLELEAVVNKEIGQAKFVQILQKIKGMGHHVSPDVTELETLDISNFDIRYGLSMAPLEITAISLFLPNKNSARLGIPLF